MKIKLIKFRDDLIKPTRAHYNDAGIDCYAQEDIILKPLSSNDLFLNFGITLEPKLKAIPTLIPLGFGLEIPDGYMATIRPRSSMNLKGVLSQIGTIDSGYRGEIKAVLINLTDTDIEIKKGEKICQIVIEPVILADFVEDLTNDRGEGGFGSTGK